MARSGVKVTSNGRRSLQELQEMFDKVIIRYIPGKSKDDTGVEKETVKTIVALVMGNDVHVGVSKWSNRGLEYSKTSGRARAAGRAEIAFNIFKNIETPRKSHIDHTTNEALSYSIKVDNTSVKNIVNTIIGVEDLNRELDLD